MVIFIKNVLIEVYNFIRLFEYYYGLLSQIYSIIITKLLEIKLELTLQMFLKILNDLVGSNSLVLIFLIFGTYPYITNINAFSTIITKHNIVI